MDSSELYHVKQQFFLGAYKTLANLPTPEESTQDYVPTLCYQARAHLALGDTKSTLNIIPKSENVAFKALGSLARYIQSPSETTLEELRDLSVEIEGDDVEGSDRDKALVKVLAGTAFARAGEIEEALETLGSESEDLEAVAVTVQIFLSINRPDLAKKEFERSKRWAEDDLLLQLIESNIGLLTGKDAYYNSETFYTEQLGNPSLSSPHILTSRGITRILRNEYQNAKSDLEESIEQQTGDAETLAAYVIATALASKKKDESEELWSQLSSEHPDHPLVKDVADKAALFDKCALNYETPPLAKPMAAYAR